MLDRDKIAAELDKPLAKSAVQPAKQYGPKGDYLEGWFVIQEANRIFGWDGWSYDLVALSCVSERERQLKSGKPGFAVTYTAQVRATVQGITRDDVGAGHGFDADCGLAHESAIKEAVTDALKRALRTFGNPFGLALYDKTRANVEDDTKPNSVSAKPNSVSDGQSVSRNGEASGNSSNANGNSPSRVLSRADGLAIVQGIQACASVEHVEKYMAALRQGPMAYAADHEKIQKAAADRMSELMPPSNAWNHPELGAPV